MASLAALLLALLALPRGGDALAFTHVELVPMDAERVLHDHTVLVRDGRIEALGPAAEISLPADAQVVDGRGRYLVPGLADMHVHTWFEEELALFLAHGVTTVRNMFGAPLHLQWRAEIERGERLGPAIYTAGPIVDGDPPVWPGSLVCTDDLDGFDAVAQHTEHGYDFVKVYTGLSPESFEAVVAAAGEAGLLVMGHAPAAVGVDGALAAGQRTIEHLSEYTGLLTDRAAQPGMMGIELWEHVDPARFAAVAERTARARVWNCPTLVVLQKWLLPGELEAELALPRMRWVPPASRDPWAPGMAKRPIGMRESVRRGEALRQAFVGALHAGGARLVLGTDQGNPFVVAGVSVHEELANFVAAGLTPYEALRTGTFEAAACMDALEEFGTVAVGRRADLLLLDENPLEDLGAVRRPAGVMARGRWLTREELDAWLEELAASYED